MLPRCTVSMFIRLSNIVNVNIRQANCNLYLPIYTSIDSSKKNKITTFSTNIKKY